MNPREWREIVDEVESLWGRSQKWNRATDVYRFAQNVPVAAAHRAVEESFLEAKSITPAPAEIIGRARRYLHSDGVGISERELRAYCSDNGHTFGIVDEANGLRTVVCATCRHEEVRTARDVPTDGEVEDGVFAEYEERIAP